MFMIWSLNLSLAIIADEECLDVAVKGFKKNTVIPVGMSRIFRKPYAVTDKCYSLQKSLNSG
jgi:hypothetical protein